MSPLTAFLLAASLTPGQAETPLAWKLKKGDTFYVRTATTAKQSIDVMGLKSNKDQGQITYHKYEVLSADKDGMVVEQTTQKRKVTSTTPGADPLAGKLNGVKLTYTFNAKFEVTKLEGYDKLMDALSGENDATIMVVKSLLSEDTLKRGVSDVFGFLPGKAAKVGDTWNREYQFGLGPFGDYAVKSESKLAESGEKGAKIAWKATTKYNLPKKDDGGLPFTISKGDLEAEKFEGEYLFDANAGRLKSGTTTVKLGGKMTIDVKGKEVEMELRQDITIEMTVSEKSLADE